MISNANPHSTAKRPSTAVTKEMNQETKQKPILRKNRQILTTLIPEMPAFANKSKSSVLLYSKFIMKGINTNKIDLVKQSFDMKKENLSYSKKTSLNYMKTLKSTKNSTKNEPLNSIRYENNEKTQFNEKSLIKDDGQRTNLETNNFYRIGSSKKSINQHNFQTNLLKVKSQQSIKRPKSAVATHYTSHRKERARTANHARSTNNSKRQLLDSNQFIPTISDTKPLTLIYAQSNHFGFVNYIEKNKRQVSASSKKSTIYLTGISDPKKVSHFNEQNNKMIQKKINQAYRSRQKTYSLVDNFASNQNQIKIKSNKLSHKQIQEIKNKNKKNIDFMKQNMPKRYKKFVEHLMEKQKNINQGENLLLSINLDTRINQFDEININNNNEEEETIQDAKDYFKDYAHICQQTEYHVNKLLKQKQNLKKKRYEQILDVHMCSQLLSLERQRIQLQDKKTNKSKDIEIRITLIKSRIYQIVKNLKFFRQKSQEICKQLFDLEFSIFSIEEDENLVRSNDKNNKMYVILNGSVTKITQNQLSQQKQSHRHGSQQYSSMALTSTFFDGQSFCQKQNQSSKNEYKASEKVLLLTFPFLQYKRIYFEASNIQEKMKILQKVFEGVPRSRSFGNQELQALAFQLDSSSFDANEVIFRKGDICDNLLIVASGKLLVANQSILKRAKKNSKDIKKRSKSASKINLKNYNLRRKNLKNYEVLDENEEQFVFYYQNIEKELVKDDTINWEGFANNYKSFAGQQQQNEKPKIQLSNNFKLPYSLISSTDNLTIYSLNMKKVQNLSETVKEIINAKIKNLLQKEQLKITNCKDKINSIQKWDLYKQKICNDIVCRKLKV